MTASPALEVTPLTPTLGARIGGIDLAEQLSGDAIVEIRQALLRYEVLFFEDQDLSPVQQRDFAARFGPLHLHPIRPSVPGTPEVLVLDNQPGPAHNIVAMNAGAAIYVAGLAATLRAGVERASQVIKSGAAKHKMEEFIAFTKQVKK